MPTMMITGATSGIGEALALHAAQQGYQVTACGRNDQALAKLSTHNNITALQFDVTDRQKTTETLRGKTFDIVVLNAGTCEYVDSEQFDADLFHRVMDVNLFGIINCLEATLPNLVAGNQIVLIDSMARLLPFTRASAYGASKAAVHYIGHSLGVDLAEQGILVQTASPGFVETPLTDKNDFEMPIKITAQQAVKALLHGIEQKTRSIYFPRRFGWILRCLNMLPLSVQSRLCRAMRDKEKSSEQA